MMTSAEEKRIIAAVRSGDRERFGAFVRAFEKMLFVLAMSRLHNEQDAMDAVQETFLRAYRGLDGFRGESRFSTWIYRTCENICTDMLRSAAKRRETALAWEEGGEYDIPDERPTPQSRLETGEKQSAVRRALAALPEEFREPLILRELSGLSYEEIGNILSLEDGTVKSRIYRARKKMLEILRSDGNFSGYEPSVSGREDWGKGGQRQ